MSRRIRFIAVRVVPVLAVLILAQSTSSAADTPQPVRPAQPQVQAPAQVQALGQSASQAQTQIQQRPVQQAYRRTGVTPAPISAMTLPAIGPSNYTVAHSERIYWGTSDRHPDPQLYPRLPSIGQPSQASEAPSTVTTASVFRYLPSSPTRDTGVAIAAGPPSASAYQNTVSATQGARPSPFGPPHPPVNVRP